MRMGWEQIYEKDIKLKRFSIETYATNTTLSTNRVSNSDNE